MDPEAICDVCRVRPATHTVQVVRGDERTIMQLCAVDFRELQGERSIFSPFEALFGREMFNTPTDLPDDFPGLASELGMPIPRRR